MGDAEKKKKKKDENLTNTLASISFFYLHPSSSPRFPNFIYLFIYKHKFMPLPIHPVVGYRGRKKYDPLSPPPSCCRGPGAINGSLWR